MPKTILDSIKPFVKIPPCCTDFDDELIGYANAVFLSLHQLIYGSDQTLFIKNGNETWDDVTTNEEIQSVLESYVGMKVSLMFDPPSTSFVITAKEEILKELEARIRDQTERSHDE